MALLTGILMAATKTIHTIAQLDERLTITPSLSDKLEIKYFRPSIFTRLSAEWRLSRHTNDQDLILCFGNLPPLFKLEGNVQVFIQNRYLIEDVSLKNFALKTRIRLLIERVWLSARMKNVDAFIVQSPTMKKLVEARTKNSVPVHVIPLMPDTSNYFRRLQDYSVNGKGQFEFVYVASGEPHKNHRNLVLAWCLLAKDNVYPSLKLTIDKKIFPDLCAWIEQRILKQNLKISNEGALQHDMVKQLYIRADAMIYPSTLESFGLPLIEARQAGLPIIASELDYVRDLIDPEESFDPNSPRSIALAVKRLMMKEEPALSLQNPEGFLRQILKREI